MEFCDPERATTPDLCARYFCTMILRTLTFAVKNVTDDQCVSVLDEIRAKYRTASDTIMTFEQITEQVGSVIIKWAPQINNYDEDFFLVTDLQSLVGNDANARQNPVTDSDRKRFYRMTTKRTRTVILDALNLMLILYARYRSFQIQAHSSASLK